MIMKEAVLWEKGKEGNKVHCFLCSHHCQIADKEFGKCGVRQNQAGSLVTFAYGRVIAANADPIEKKPLYHFLPGSTAYSIATIGCNFHCGFCQNWEISQVTVKDGFETSGMAMTPEQVVANARKAGCKSVAYTYTEPTIFFEYARDIAQLAREKGLANIFVTNGYMTEQAIREARPWLDAANVDLKSFRDGFYRSVCVGSLAPVLDSIRLMRELGIWVEVTTLIVPGENDSPEELKELAQFLAGVDRQMPWHISRFYPNYRFTDKERTPEGTLKMARDLGFEAGLKYVYVGNIYGWGNDTSCPHCGKLLVDREVFSIKENNVRDGKCRFCGTEIAGRF